MYARQFITLLGRRAPRRYPEIETLFAAGEQGMWRDPSDFSTMWQDSAGTTKVTAVGQPVGLISDKSGRGHHGSQASAGSRPILRQDGSGFYYLEYDGLKSLATNSIDLTGTNKITVGLAIRKLSDAAAAIFMELSASVSANTGAFYVAAPNNAATGNFGFVVKGTSQVVVSPLAASPGTFVFSGQADIAGPTTNARINGGTATSSASSLGTGNFGNFPIYTGMRSGGLLPFTGREYASIVRGAASSVAEQAAIDSWLDSKSGAY